MRGLSAILILLSCQTLTISAIPTFEEFKRLRGQSAETTKEILDDMRAKVNTNIPGMPALPKFMVSEPIETITLDAPLDLSARKRALDEMRDKLASIRAGVLSGTQKPTKDFFDDMQKTLEASMKVKLVEFKVNKIENLDAFRAATRQSKTPTVVKRLRNIENFTAEIIQLHEENLDLHRFMLEGTHTARISMVENIFEIFSDLMSLLAHTTEHLWNEQNSVEEAIANADGSQACISEQAAIFNTRSRYFGDELNRCTYFTNNHARRYLREVFYPTLDSAIRTVNGHQYMILEVMSRTNMARDQERVLQLLENDFANTRDRWANNWQVMLGFEENRFDDELVWERAELVECLNYIETGYSEAGDDIREALTDC